MKIIILIKILFLSILLQDQIQIKGTVIDSNNKSALSFANIGIKHKNVGAVSLADGTFKIEIPEQNENDTLTFSMVGYEELNLPIKQIGTTSQKVFQLKMKTEVKL